MKKFLSCLLAIFLLLQSTPIVIHADGYEDDIHLQTQDQSKEDGSSVDGTEQKENETEVKHAVGNVEIRVFHREMTKNLDSFTATLYAADGHAIAGVMEPYDASSDVQVWKFDAVANGTYAYHVTGNHYETYMGEVKVQGNVNKIRLINTHRYGQSYVDANTNIGSFGYGDFNEDGILDYQDKMALLHALDEGSQDPMFDVNNDGVVNLADLSAFAYSYADPQSEQTVISLHAEVETFALPMIVEEEMTGAIAQGSLTDILTNSDQVVSFQPSDVQADISETNPIEIGIHLTDEQAAAYVVDQVRIVGSNNHEHQITNGTIYVESVSGETIAAPIISSRLRTTYAQKAAATAIVQEDGTIVLDLGEQVAIKKVVIRITDTTSKKLADIAQVEFLNGMEDRIPAPKLDIPTNVEVENGDERFTVSWTSVQNITGYQVKVSYQGTQQVFYTEETTLAVTKLNNKDILNGETYEVSVQAVNGDVTSDDYWQSGYSEPVWAKPEPAKVPDAPDNVKATGAYQSIQVSWKKMKSTDSYNLYYRKKNSGDYVLAASGITKNSYTIDGLEDGTTYQVYVTGTNKIGTSKPSIVNEASTTITKPAEMPNYKLINTSNGEGVLSAHIVSTIKGRGTMMDSALDAEGSNTANGVFDNSYSSYYYIGDWDEGGAYPGSNKGVTAIFDDVYEMNYITFAEVEDIGSYTYVNVQYVDEMGAWKQAPASISRKVGSNGRAYYAITLANPIKTNKVKVGIGRYGSSPYKVIIAEMNFYYYDSIEDDVNALFADSLHLTLKEQITKTYVDELQKRLDTPDKVSGEYHYNRTLIQKELDMAYAILAQEDLGKVISIDPNISTQKDGYLGISGLNAWQPLGVVGYEGETIVVYVGQTGKRNGDAVNVKLVASQYHAESSAFVSSPINLKVGRNEITLPKIQSLSAESGGALYVQYTGNNAKDEIGVRVSGGAIVPSLNLYNISDEAERLARVTTYVQELESYVPTIADKHEAEHTMHSVTDYAFSKENCIFGATDIMLNQMMYSVSSQQILAGLQGTNEEKAQQLLASLDAMDDMMHLFYQHKGLSNAQDATAKNKLPSQHLNIRYQRMFAGAFMYAGGNHIGIEWGSIPGLTKGSPIVSDNGKYVSGNYFGWGISHEIGHNINQGSYAIAEITNNYFAILSRSDDTNDTTRFTYPNVYKKVTSGVKGRDANVFTQLAMYWQLHLAYDQSYNYTTFDTYQEQFDNLFYARVDSFARDVTLAPQAKEHGVALTLTGDVDQKFMRLASAAAKKDLTTFFTAWGMTPDAGTKAYMEQWPQETRDIQYIDDNSRSYQLEQGAAMSPQTSVFAELTHEENSNQITLSLQNNNQQTNAMLGYEIQRNGKVIAFVPADQKEYVDTISAMNHRVFTYSIVGYDRYLHKTEPYTLDPVKISHDGSLDKTDWTLTTNMTSKADEEQMGNGDDPCAPAPLSAITNIIDNDQNTIYEGSVKKGNAEIIIAMNEKNAITGIKYTGSSNKDDGKAFDIYVSQDNTNWELVKSDTMTLDEQFVAKIFFNKENDHSLYTYDAAYVKIVVKNTSVEIAELDILGPSGDNVDILKEHGIGILQDDYIIDAQAQTRIPAGSLIFTGEYKGDPAYNVIKLLDADGAIISGMQVIFADVPKHGELAEIAEGTWIYYLEPLGIDEKGNMQYGIQGGLGEADLIVPIPTQVKAELYRVNDAQTMLGERLTSDSLYVDVPKQLPVIKLQGKQ